MSDHGTVDDCEALVDALAEVIDGQRLLLVAAAIGHIIGRTTSQPEQLLDFFDTLAASATLYATCTCGQCEQPTKH